MQFYVYYDYLSIYFSILKFFIAIFLYSAVFAEHKVRYSKLCGVYEKLSSTSKRLTKIYYISEFLKELPEKDYNTMILLLQGRLFPAWDEQKIGVAARLVIKAINISTGIDLKDIEKRWKELGDLGEVAEDLVSKKKQATLFSQDLEVMKVYSNLISLATLTGAGVVDRKVKLISELLTSAKPVEAKYIVRSALEDMRVGVGDGTIRDAIVHAFFSAEKVGRLERIHDESEDFIYNYEDDQFDNKKEYVKVVQNAYNITNDFGRVIDIARKDGVEGLEAIEIEVGQPLKVMLYPKATDVEDAFRIVGKPAAFEYKYDGFRVQIHVKGDEVNLFTRRLENVTTQFPDVVESVKKYVKSKNVILDSEVVGYNPKTNQYLPFQSISQRIKRKHNILEAVEKFPVEINVFDILYNNGESLIKRPFNERRRMLSENVDIEPRKIVLSRIVVTSDPDEASSFYQEALDMGEEGVMAKSLTAPYEPGARVGNGVKLKQVMDGLDLVIVGADWGEGKRANWLASFTLATMDSEGEYVEVGKVSTGIKELSGEGVTYKEMTELLEPLIISEKGRTVRVKPEIVIEVHYEEIQKSTNYSSGYALRFPRFVRLRDDRRADELSTIEDIEDLYFGQRNRNS